MNIYIYIYIYIYTNFEKKNVPKEIFCPTKCLQ